MRGESNLPKKVENKNDEILNKLEYLGLDLDKLPKAITNFEELEYRIPKFYEENKYRQKYTKKSESVFTTENGYMGIR